MASLAKLMIAYFPIDTDAFELKMNARAYDGPLIEVDADTYHSQVALRRTIARSEHGAYHVCPECWHEAAWETLELILTDMATHSASHFHLNVEGRRMSWRNDLLGDEFEVIAGDLGTLPADALSPLDLAGAQVQEDLILMHPSPSGALVCVAGHLCFASGWSLPEKLGLPFLEIHAHIPQFVDRIGVASDLLMRRLRPGRPVMRLNWTISESDDLNRAPSRRSHWETKGREVTESNAGERCFFRVEKQTLTRLARTGATLFTIHTYINTIAEVCADPERARILRGAVAAMSPETVAYKHAGDYYDALVAYLNRRVG